MVQPPMFRAFQFEQGLSRLRRAFRTTMTEMRREHDAATARAADYHLSGADDDEYDEDGTLVRSTRVEVDYAAIDADLASIAARQAFVTAAFHYWERSARAWTGARAIGFQSLRLRIEELGHSVHAELETLNLLNNLLKHDDPRRGRELKKRRPDLLVDTDMTSDHSWHAALRISDADVEWCFDVVAGSGPVVP